MINKFIWIGYGSIAKSLQELFNLEKLYYDIPYIIIDPLPPTHTELFDNRNVKYIQKAITPENYKRLLKDADDKTLIIDLSVNVDTIMLLKWCKLKGSFYINTSIENYESTHKKHTGDVTYDDIKENTLLHRELLAEEVMNPGAIQAFFKRGIREYAKMKGKKIIKGNYAKLSKDLGLKEVIIAEYDSQKTNIKPTRNKFINTWSANGYMLEATDEVMLSLNNEDLKKIKTKVTENHLCILGC